MEIDVETITKTCTETTIEITIKMTIEVTVLTEAGVGLEKDITYVTLEGMTAVVDEH